MFFVINPVSDWYKTKEMCDGVVSKDPFKQKYCLDRYKTQKMCDEAVGYYMSALTFVPDWFVASIMIKKF